MRPWRILSLALMGAGGAYASFGDGLEVVLLKDAPSQLYYLPALIETTAPIYTGAVALGSATGSYLLLDTANINSWMFGSTCTTCSETQETVNALLSYPLCSPGAVKFGMNSVALGQQSMTEVGLYNTTFSYVWMQSVLLVGSLTGDYSPPTGDSNQYLGSFALGRLLTYRDYATTLGNWAAFNEDDSVFGVDFAWKVAATYKLYFGRALCQAQEATRSSADNLFTAPVYDMADYRWNVYMLGFTRYSDTTTGTVDWTLALRGSLIIDTTRKYSVFKESVAHQLAISLAGVSPVTRTYSNGYWYYRTDSTTLPTNFIINLNNEPPYLPLDNGYRNPRSQFLTISNYYYTVLDDTKEFYFVGSDDSCTVTGRNQGSSCGLKSYLGTAFLEGFYIGFRNTALRFIQAA